MFFFWTTIKTMTGELLLFLSLTIWVLHFCSLLSKRVNQILDSVFLWTTFRCNSRSVFSFLHQLITWSRDTARICCWTPCCCAPCCCGGRLCRPYMELGHWVTGSVGHLGHLSRPGHRVIILTRCEPRVFQFSKKNAKRTFEMLKWQKSLSGVCCWTEITGCQSVQWTFTFTYDY